jgi:hypothetical protein
MSRRLFVMAASVAALCGCAATPLESDYGQSYRQLVENQVFDRATLSNPSTAPVEGADPDMINLAVQSLRTESIDRSQVSQPLVINVAGGK